MRIERTAAISAAIKAGVRHEGIFSRREMYSISAIH